MGQVFKSGRDTVSTPPVGKFQDAQCWKDHALGRSVLAGNEESLSTGGWQSYFCLHGKIYTQKNNISLVELDKKEEIKSVIFFLEKTMDSWSIRDEVLRSVNQWYLIFVFIIVGGLIGFLIAYLVPSPFQATAEIYVGIDIARVNEMESIIPLASSEQLNLDDYNQFRYQ